MRKALIGGLTITILLTMGGLRMVDLWRDRGDRLSAAERRAANLALILSEYLTEAFAASDAVLRQLALHSRRVGGPAAPPRDWQPSLTAAGAGVAGMGTISLVDSQGTIRHSTRADIIGRSRPDSYIVRQAFKAKGDDLIVGTPFQPSGAPASLLIPLARRLTDARGETTGAIVAAFIPADLRSFFDSVDVGERGTVWVFHRDGAVLFRAPSTSDVMGESAAGHPVFAAAADRSSGVVRGPMEAGGAEMVSAFRVASAPHLITAVSLDRDEVLVNWTSEANAFTATVGVAGMLLSATLVVLFRQMDAKAAAERALQHARELEAERLRDANERLSQTLEREQLARREAEAASTLKDQFLMTVSHELRTPLTAIAGWSRMLVDGMVTEGRRQAALESIARNAQTQTRLIEDLLDVSAIMAGKMRLDVKRVNVAEVVKTSVDAVRSNADAKAVSLDLSLRTNGRRVQGDAERLRQVVWNLLSNAIKFTPSGGNVCIGVVDEDAHVRIEVIDTGVGIDHDFLPHVFDQFRQADSSPSRRHGGLGLGLSIVQSLVELHGGSVTAQSDGKNRGATFTVRLPAIDEGPYYVASEAAT
jgi:signal transduction histidine kinase